MDARGRRSLATALAAPELTPALSPVYDVATSKTQRPSMPLRMRRPVNGHEAVYEWHQKRAHELVAGIGVVMDGHAWQFGEPVGTVAVLAGAQNSECNRTANTSACAVTVSLTIQPTR